MLRGDAGPALKRQTFMAIGDEDGKLAARISHSVAVALRPYYVVAL